MEFEMEGILRYAHGWEENKEPKTEEEKKYFALPTYDQSLLIKTPKSDAVMNSFRNLWNLDADAWLTEVRDGYITMCETLEKENSYLKSVLEKHGIFELNKVKEQTMNQTKSVSSLFSYI
jgi:hypothetical protein